MEIYEGAIEQKGPLDGQLQESAQEFLSNSKYHGTDKGTVETIHWCQPADDLRNRVYALNIPDQRLKKNILRLVDMIEFPLIIDTFKTHEDRIEWREKFLPPGIRKFIEMSKLRRNNLMILLYVQKSLRLNKIHLSHDLNALMKVYSIMFPCNEGNNLYDQLSLYHKISLTYMADYIAKLMIEEIGAIFESQVSTQEVEKEMVTA